MGNTLAEVSAALDAFAEIEPTLAGIASIFAPQYVAVFAPFAGLFQVAVKAVDVVSQDASTGKGFTDIVNDVVNHLTPGQPNAPALSPAAPPATAPAEAAGM